MSATRVGVGIAASIALALPLALAGAPGPTLTGPASAADCVPVQHSKQVVKRKKVRRHGKWVKVKRKRTKRWWTCEPPSPASCAEPATSLGVTAYDTSGTRYSLSRPCVSAGLVNVELRNQGEDPHNLFMRPAGGTDPVYSIPEETPFELPPLSQQDRSVTLSAGDWYLWCSLLTHEQQGMNATLLVR